jgi:isoleucyl-tRNA synthetase
MSENNQINYKKTLNLPKTSFPMKAGLPQREPAMLKTWESEKLYEKILADRKAGDKQFILHDGPPYANGHIHMGHVLNKILKDITIKYQTLRGAYAPYVPGWDCHGLPVEHQLFKELGMTKEDISQVEFRKKAYKYAMKYVRIQAKEFKRFGIMGDWDNPYLTVTRGYEADILYSLADLYGKGYIYKGLKPVNWCGTCETALAEAEVEYEDKISPSIYVKFPIPEGIDGKKASMVIWTTTPWTLLANVAIAVHPEYDYSLVEVDGEILIMLSDIASVLMGKFGLADHKVVKTISGQDVVDTIKAARHPFLERASTLVLADYVTKEEGTGCVHTAPGHGQDDYATGKKYDLEVIMPVNLKGRFNDDIEDFGGMQVLKANAGIIEKLISNGTLLKTGDITHSYPHCWRCKSPIIFRATEQWFMSIDHKDLREKMEKDINEDVQWVPEAGKDRIKAMVKNRPDWCLSRQRYWGVPIPAFQCENCGEAFTDEKIIRKVADLTQEFGADVWFEKSVDEFLPEGKKCEGCGKDKFRKEEDILDVWFDSGVSHQAVLTRREELDNIADLYLEGSDQHRGWFQSSLITSMAMNERPPYKTVLTHGFVVDGEGKKMSKSIGNVISPEDVMKQYGADILRLWVSSSDYEGDIKLSSEILARLADGYRKLRNTFRYFLSNLNDFNIDEDMPKYDEMPETDKWMLSRLTGLLESTAKYYDSYEFHKVYRAVYDFCVCEVSSFYLDISKDILYVDAERSLKRRSSQTVIYHMLNVLVRILAPILVFTTDEVWGYFPKVDDLKSVHMSRWPENEGNEYLHLDKSLDDKWNLLLEVRDSILKVLEEKREDGVIGSSLDARLIMFSEDASMDKLIEENIDLFSLIFRVSQVERTITNDPGMEEISGTKIKIKVDKALGDKCPRCWNYTEEIDTRKEFAELCNRCSDVMIERSNNGN